MVKNLIFLGIVLPLSVPLAVVGFVGGVTVWAVMIGVAAAADFTEWLRS